MSERKLPRQVIPLIILAGALLVALVVARLILVPKTFGEFGHYRGAAPNEVASRDITYAGSNACMDCHSDIYELKRESNHKGLACEVCHGPAEAHVNAPDSIKPTIPRGRGYCPLCHGYNPSRPSGFPQILPELHNPGKACITCHNPHQPVLPHPPEDCSACHREIASTKMVSKHTSVPCITCHVVPADHWQNPQVSLAKKPQTREVCGQCHDTKATSSAEIPRIDIETHGGRYMCWDCHYPHSPEANP